MAKGIFLPSDNLDTSLMISYLQSLLNVCPSVRCTAVKVINEELKGFKIYFSEPEEDTVLKERHMTVDTQRVSIYPVSATFLIIGRNKRADDSFRVDLIEAINQVLGKRVLDTVDLGKNYDYEKWVVKIDIPEFELSDREIYSRLNERLPNRELSVRSWCRNCNDPGHFFHECEENTTEAECLKILDISTATANKNDIPSGSDKQNESISKSSPRSPPERAGGYSGIDKYIESYAEKIGREEILKGIQDEIPVRKNRNGSKYEKMRTTFGGSFSEDIKKEVEEEQEQQDIKKHHSSDKLLANREPVLKKETPSSFQRDDNISNSCHSENSNDDFLNIDQEASPSHAASRDSNFSRTDDTAFSEASRSPTTSKSTTSASATSRSTQKRAKPTSRVEITTVLSNRLQDCINHACGVLQVLDRQKLDAFFTHVKKKSNPIRVALNFTKDADGLKMQLEMILDRYYSTPQTGTKEDMQFIKWLNGLVERFDGAIPRKRKPSNKNRNEPPSKK